jgi:hypothetical protein
MSKRNAKYRGPSFFNPDGSPRLGQQYEPEPEPAPHRHKDDEGYPRKRHRPGLRVWWREDDDGFI